ncbi:MAG: ABC transporter ATP-binding protein [Bacillota bacterium]
MIAGEAGWSGTLPVASTGPGVIDGSASRFILRAARRLRQVGTHPLQMGWEGKRQVNAPTVVVRDLRKQYGDVVAVDGISFSVGAGEIFGLLGPNGAGKTTTVECLEGLRQPDEGTVELLGRTQGSQERGIRERMGVQLQNTGLIPNLTVLETLRLFAAFFSRSHSPETLLDMVGLREKRNERCSALSGGQRQRLTLALAVVNDPEVIFLDEPTTGLDPQARRGVWEIINQLRERGRTVLLTTHYMEEAQRLCDRVAIMDQGRIIVSGPPADLLKEHLDEATIEFAAPEQVPLEAFQALPGVLRAAGNGSEMMLSTANIPETVGNLLDLARGRGFELNRFTVRSPTLEDLFLKLTGRTIRN